MIGAFLKGSGDGWTQTSTGGCSEGERNGTGGGLFNECTVCVLSIISNPLHAARRAMAAAYRCPCGQQQIFSPPIETEISVPNHCGSYWGTPFSYYPNPSNKKEKRVQLKKRKGQRKRKQLKAGPAHPPRPLSSGPPPRPCPHPSLPSQPTPCTPPSCPPDTLRQPR